MESPTNPQLLFIGTKCALPICDLHDFLPIECPYCSISFCSNHYKTIAHKCSKVDSPTHDRVASPCCLCQTPVAIAPGEDPNVAMKRHTDSACAVQSASKKKQSSPRCANVRGKKVLYAPTKCNSCNKEFCPSHRFPNTHSCVRSTNAKSTSPPAPPLAKSSGIPNLIPSACRVSAASDTVQCQPLVSTLPIYVPLAHHASTSATIAPSIVPTLAAVLSKPLSGTGDLPKTDRREPSTSEPATPTKTTPASTRLPLSSKYSPPNAIAENPARRQTNPYAPLPLFDSAGKNGWS